MDRYEHYSKLFYEELKNRRDLDRAVNIPILVITTIIAFLTYIIEALDYKNGFFNLQIKGKIIMILVLIIFLLLIVSIINVIKSYNNYLKGYNYEILGSNQEFENYREDLIEYKNTYDDEVEFNPEKKFKSELIKKIVFATDNNSEINIKRNHYLFLAKRHIVIALVLSFITFITLVIEKI